MEVSSQWPSTSDFEDLYIYVTLFSIRREHTERSILSAIDQVHIIKCAESLELQNYNHKIVLKMVTGNFTQAH